MPRSVAHFDVCTVSHEPTAQVSVPMYPSLYSVRYSATKTPASATSAASMRLFIAAGAWRTWRCPLRGRLGQLLVDQLLERVVRDRARDHLVADDERRRLRHLAPLRLLQVRLNLRAVRVRLHAVVVLGHVDPDPLREVGQDGPRSARR